MDQPLRDPLSPSDHATLQRLDTPSFRALLAFMTRGKAESPEAIDRAVHVLDEASDPQFATFVSKI